MRARRPFGRRGDSRRGDSRRGEPPVVGKARGAAGAAGGSLLSVRGLSRSFGDVVALDDVTLDIRPNEFFALLGPSGCGKTTLLRILAGFEAPDAGEVRLDGRDLLAVPPHRRPVNLMFQSYALFPHLTVRQNVAFGLERERLPRGEIRQRVDEVLETVGLTGEHRRRPAQLSGGQRQRVALARAIVKRPRLLLLDEPLSALDRKVRAEMQLELKRLQHEVGITFVVVTHDQGEALSLADRVAVLSQGRLRQVSDPVSLYERPADVFVASFVGETNLLAGRWGVGAFEADALGTVPGPEPTASDIARAMAHPSWLSLRPERLVLGPPGAGVLDGDVLEVQYVGGASTVAVAVADRERPLLVRVTGPPGVRRGETVSLAWRASDAVLLGPEPVAGPPGASRSGADPTVEVGLGPTIDLSSEPAGHADPAGHVEPDRRPATPAVQ